MYAILNINNEIVDFENREVQITDLVHPSMQHLYIPITNDGLLKIGDTFNPETNEWIIIDSTEKIEQTIVPQIHTPTNVEIAKMISDLQADLIIAGVI